MQKKRDISPKKVLAFPVVIRPATCGALTGSAEEP